MARLAFRGGNHAAAVAWVERALAEVGEAGGRPDRGLTPLRAEAYNTLGIALARTGRLPDAAKKIETSIEIAEAAGLLHAACRGYATLGVLYATLDPARSVTTCLRGLDAARTVGDVAFQSRLYANLAVAYCALTDECESRGAAAARAAVDLDRRLGLRGHLAVPLIILGQIRQCHGEHDVALALYEEATRLAEQLMDPQLLFPSYDGLATLYLDTGNTGMAETYLAKARDVCERAGLEPDGLLMLPFLC
jgi:tetratricopeptide (TPR) repeat protein